MSVPETEKTPRYPTECDARAELVAVHERAVVLFQRCLAAGKHLGSLVAVLRRCSIGLAEVESRFVVIEEHRP